MPRFLTRYRNDELGFINEFHDTAADVVTYAWGRDVRRLEIYVLQRVSPEIEKILEISALQKALEVHDVA